MRKLIEIGLLLVLPLAMVNAQEQGETLAATLDVFVFPADGQAADQQSKDEVECYAWATENTGSDPFELQKQSAQKSEQAQQQSAQAQSATKGAGARGAVRGAAAGALIGEATGGDAGESAGYGAAAGAIGARRRTRAASEQTQQQLNEQDVAQQQATAKQIDHFKKAFSVCLEAKEYMVKF